MPLNGSGQQNFNFAIARVRLQGAAGSAPANNVRVFFRLFVAESCDTDFQPSTTYKSQQGTSGPDAGKPVSRRLRERDSPIPRATAFKPCRSLQPMQTARTITTARLPTSISGRARLPPGR